MRLFISGITAAIIFTAFLAALFFVLPLILFFILALALFTVIAGMFTLFFLKFRNAFGFRKKKKASEKVIKAEYKVK